jgi:hypothetical protein
MTKNEITGDRLVTKTSNAYRDNYDAIFNKKEKSKAHWWYLILLPILTYELVATELECQKDYDLALSVMQQRQKDNNLIEAMELYDKKIVMSAYSQPQQRTIRLRIEAAKNFANLNAQKCFKWGIL